MIEDRIRNFQVQHFVDALFDKSALVGLNTMQ
jgi:hypothetical protein